MLIYTSATKAFAAINPKVSAPNTKTALISAWAAVDRTTSFLSISAIAQNRSLLPEPS